MINDRSPAYRGGVVLGHPEWGNLKPKYGDSGARYKVPDVAHIYFISL